MSLMSRRRYLIAYDIAEPRRLRHVIRVMEGVGTRLQYSVFLCDLSRRELLLWRASILDAVNLAEDSVILIDLGTMRNDDIVVMGVPRSMPLEGAQVV